MTEGLTIVEYSEKYKKDFYRINEAWIRQRFYMEEIDEKVLSDPGKYILQPGGTILIALYKGKAAGTCALTNEGNGVYELTKMGVDEKYRGLKIGYWLGIKTIEKGKSSGAKKIILHSNTKNSAEAIELYKKLGFKEVPLGHAEWARADIKMELVII